MTNCECPASGYCQRHKVNKSTAWYRLCKLHESYYQAWEAGRGPGQDHVIDERQIKRRVRVREATERKQRLVSWLIFFRADIDRGVGDTADRILRQQAKSKLRPKTDANKAICHLLSQCSCSRVDAVDALNAKYPY